jgi:hypothetical protein
VQDFVVKLRHKLEAVDRNQRAQTYRACHPTRIVRGSYARVSYDNTRNKRDVGFRAKADDSPCRPPRPQFLGWPTLEPCGEYQHL